MLELTHVDQLKEALRSGPRLRLAMLFGSAARGELRPASDLDVAILPANAALPLRDELDLQVELTRACGREVDLVRLDRASTLVKWQVARHGVALLVCEPFALSRFLASTAAEYLDFAPAFAHASERFRRRLAAAADRRP